MPEDLHASTSTTAEVAVNGSLGGTLEALGDVDWIRVRLEAGIPYTIEIRGFSSGGGTLWDPLLEGLHNASGAWVAETAVDDRAVGNYDPLLVFTPVAGGIYYVAVTSMGGAFTGSYTVVVTAPNNAPASAPASATTQEDTQLSGTLPAASDPDGDAFAYVLTQAPSHGSVVLSANGSYTYTPAQNFNGSDSFRFAVRDARGASSSAYTVSLTVTPVADIPVAVNGSSGTPEDTRLAGTLPAATDADGDALTYMLLSDAAHGSVTVNTDGSFTYMPHADFSGTDTFTFTASDGVNNSNMAAYTIAVSAVNDPPTGSVVISGSAVQGQTLRATNTLADADGIPANGAGAVRYQWKANGTSISGATADTYLLTQAEVGKRITVTASYTDSQGHVESASSEATSDVVNVNDAPVGMADAFTAIEDTPITYAAAQLLGNDVDADGDALTIKSVSAGSGGTAVLNPNGTVTFTPDANHHGNGSFSYVATDAYADSTPTPVLLTIAPVNDAPTAANGSASTPEDTPLTSSLPASTDVDGDSVTYTKASNPSHGSLTVNPNGSYSYTPSPNYSGSDSFTFTTSDSNGGSNTYTHSLTITPVNDAPVLANALLDQGATASSPFSYTVSTSAFTDVDNASLTYTATRADGSALPAWLSFNASTRSFSGTPTSADLGTLSVKVTASDGSLSATGTFNLVVNTAPNTAPTAANGSASTPEDTPLSSTLPTATDANGDTVTYAKASNPSHGIALVHANGTYSYTPAENHNGSDAFTFSVSDGMGGSNVYTLSLTITTVNDAPVASNGSGSGIEDDQITGTVSATDVEGSTLSYTVVSPPTHGSLTLATNGSYTYTPNANYHGSDSFGFKANDGSADSNTATVSLTITAANDAPASTDGAASAAEDTTIVGTLPSASDVDGDTITYAKASNPSHGSVIVNAGGTYSYTPNANYNGTDSFTFSISDGKGGSNVYTQSLTITAVNDAPVASNGSRSGSEDSVITGTVSATDVEGSTLSYTVVSPPTHGSLTLATNGSYTYTPDANYHGSDSFGFKASDGVADSNAATVSLIISAINDAPEASNGSRSGSEDSAITGTVSATDVEGSTLSYTVVSPPSHGSVVLDANGSYTYTPDADYSGSDSFSFKASDGSADSNTAAITLTISAVNDAPMLVNALLDQSATASIAFSYTVPASTFTDVDNASLTYTAALANGSALPAWLNFNGSTRSFSGTPSAAELGTLSVKVTASDGSLSASDTFDLVVNAAPNTTPTSTNGSDSTAEDTTLNGSLPAATDANGDAITYAKASNPSHGSVIVNAGGTYSYTPNANYNGTDSFTFSISDGKGGSNVYTQSLTIAAVNDAPVASNGSRSGSEDSVITGTVSATDVEGSTLSYTVVSPPTHGSLTLVNNGSYIYTPDADYNGSDSFSFKANDGQADSNTATVSLTITAVNDAPVVANALPDQSATASSAFSYTVSAGAFSDPDSPWLTYSATLANGSALPAWLSFNTSTRSFSGTPTSADLGTLSVKVTASDGSLSASDTFDLEIAQSISGIVQDGYVAGAALYLDLNGNGVADPEEDTGLRTDSQGRFEGVVANTAAWIAVGGTNVDTGLRNTLTLAAPAGASVINPLTTIVHQVQTLQGVSTAQAQEWVSQALTLPQGVDLLSFDPLATPNDPQSLALHKANVQLALTATLAGDQAIPAIAQAVATSTQVNLADLASLALVTSATGASTETLAALAQANTQVQAAGNTHQIAQTQQASVLANAPAGSDWSAPQVSSFSPTASATGVLPSSPIVLSFNEPVQRGSGAIVLKTLTGQVVATYGLDDPAVTISGQTLTLNPVADLGMATGYRVSFEPGSVRDLAGNAYVGTADYSFLTQGATLGTGSADLMSDQTGDDWFYGAQGLDAVSFNGTRAQHSAQRLDDGLIRLSGPGGTDVLQDVERAIFNDSALAFDVSGVGGTAYRLYQAAYDRAPDAEGLGFWMYYLDRGFDLTEAANNFLIAPEFKAIYGDNPSNEQYVYLLYKHVHHREPDLQGLQFWIDAMYNKDGAFGKQWSKGEILLKFSESPENIANLMGVMENGFVYMPLQPGP